MRLDELLDRDLSSTQTVPVLLSADAAETLDRAERAVQAARRRVEAAEQREEGQLQQPGVEQAKADLEQAEAELEEAQDAAVEHLVDFKVRSIPSARWQQLVTDNPPSKQQKDRYGAGLDYDPNRFPVAALAECLVEPEVTSVADVERLQGRLPEAVWQQLWAACLKVNIGGNKVPFSLIDSVTNRSSVAESGSA